jgi:hypothetical protein
MRKHDVIFWGGGKRSKSQKKSHWVWAGFFEKGQKWHRDKWTMIFGGEGDFGRNRRFWVILDEK